MITSKQREALNISAFGFNTHNTNAQRAATASLGSKLAKSLHTTGGAEVVVTQPEKDSVRFHLCVQALEEGCVQSFMHLFHLSHRDPVCVDELSQTYFTIDDDRLHWVQQQLSAVEVLRRQSEFREVIDRCKALANFFEREGDVKEVVWHYEAALQYALESLDSELEMEVREDFARFYERRERYTDAATMYESLYRLAVAVRQEERCIHISVALVHVYQVLGDHRKETDPHAARIYYEKSAKFAKISKSGAEEGRALNSLGKIHEQTGNLRTALQYQRNYSHVSHNDNLRDNECAAMLNVAGLQERLGMNMAATASLRNALQLARNLKEPAKVSRAMMQLGEVHRAEGNEAAAMQCFKESFQPACESGEQDLIDSARVAMGFAMGEFYFKHAGNGRGYLPIVCEDVVAQLGWMSDGVL